MRYFKTPIGKWVSEKQWNKHGLYDSKAENVKELLDNGGFYGQYLPDGSFEDRSDIITVP